MLTQTDRLLQIDTPLGPNKLVMKSFAGREAISQLFSFDVEVVSEDSSIKASDILARNVNLRILLPDFTSRYINGFVSNWALTSYEDRYTHYRMRVVPWLWFLTRTMDCLIFQEKTAPEIIEDVFRKYRFTDYRLRLTSTYRKREYCVQYRETSCDFVMRLMEEEGIYFYFTHEEGKHVLVMGDNSTGHAPCPTPSCRFEPTSGSGYNRDEDFIRTWNRQYEIRPGQWAQADFNFKSPRVYLMSNAPTVIQGVPKYEVYDYPGAFIDRTEGDNLTKIRMEEEEAAYEVISGESDFRCLTAGHKFKLEDHWTASENDNYTVTSVSHYGRQEGMESGHETEEMYANSFTCIPFQRPYRPQRVTPKPVVRGVQTAIVVGPAGQEIHADSHGRIKVQFHWDREGLYNEKSSCWIRVAQEAAGKGWGGISLPRVGQEVIVDFVEGDPDRPIVTGRVYNADSVVPYALPDNLTITTFKSLSSKGGGGFNELRFEDKKGSEQVFLHAEKELDIRVKNDRKEWIGRDRHLVVKRDRVNKVERDDHTEVVRDQVTKIARDRHVTIQGKSAEQITGSMSLKVTGAVAQQFASNCSQEVTGNLYVKGANVVIEGAAGLTLKVGGNFISINAGGIFIKGNVVMINSGGAPLSGAPGALVTPLAVSPPLDADNAQPGTMSTLPPNPPRPNPFILKYVGATAAEATSVVVAAAPGHVLFPSDNPVHNPLAEENQEKKSWIEIELLDEAGQPVPGEVYRIVLPDGTTVAEGTLDDKGFARVDNIDPGSCRITFPNLDQESWS